MALAASYVIESKYNIQHSNIRKEGSLQLQKVSWSLELLSTYSYHGPRVIPEANLTISCSTYRIMSLLQTRFLAMSAKSSSKTTGWVPLKLSRFHAPLPISSKTFLEFKMYRLWPLPVREKSGRIHASGNSG